MPVHGQQNFYEKDLPSSAFHKERRDALRAAMPENSLAVFFSNPVRIRSNDVDFQYSQDPDLYYLTGCTEPDAVLLVFSSPHLLKGVKISEVLFVQGRDSAAEIWTGRRLSKDEVVSILGIERSYETGDFSDLLPDLSGFNKVMVKFPADISEGRHLKKKLGGLVWLLRDRAASRQTELTSAPLLKIMASLREIKTKEEIALIQKAVDITVEGMAEVIRAFKPGMTEYQAQAIAEFYFKYRGAAYPGYGSISGGGENSCVLHYVTNRKTLSENDMLLMDMGAEYHGYTADITRTIPVSGRFSPEQKAIYELVLDAQLAAIATAVNGKGFYDPHQAALKVISEGLVRLGIIKDASRARRYFNHGSSHYLGLEVHDPGSYGPLKAGMEIGRAHV